MRYLFSIVLSVLLVFAVPVLAGEPQQAEISLEAAGGFPCSLTGTWIGASDPTFPFLWTFSPAPGGQYTSITQLAYDLTQVGYTFWTDWIGEATRVGPRSFDSWGVSFWIWDPAAAAELEIDATFPELEIVRSRLDMVDCDTFTSTIDIYASYFAWTAERVPFIDTPDLSYLEPGQTLVETYHRVPRQVEMSAQPGGPLVPEFTKGNANTLKLRRKR